MYKCPNCGYPVSENSECIEDNEVVGCIDEDGTKQLCSNYDGDCIWEKDSIDCQTYKKEIQATNILVSDLE